MNVGELLTGKGLPSRVEERVRRRVIQELDCANFALGRQITRVVGREAVKGMTLEKLRKEMVAADGRVQESELRRRARLCCAEEAQHADAMVDVPRFLEQLRKRCCVELHGAGAARRSATPPAAPP